MTISQPHIQKLKQMLRPLTGRSSAVTDTAQSYLQWLPKPHE